MLDLENMAEMMKDPEQQGLVYAQITEYMKEKESEVSELKSKAETATKNATETSKKLVDYAQALTINNRVETQPEKPQPKDMEDYIMNHCSWTDVANIILGKKEVPNFGNS